MDIQNRTTILIADLGYGDAGKGSIVDYLTRTTHAHTIVRYNGGAQAAHNVVTPDGKHHTFAQFGSGTLVPGTRTHLSRFMMVHPLAMLAEERHLRSLGVSAAFQRVSIDREALVTTPFQQSANRLKELARGGGRHGSCGMGVGETMSDWLEHGSQVLFIGDLSSRKTVIRKLNFLRDVKIAQLETVTQDLMSIEAARTELQALQKPDMIETTADLYQYFYSMVSVVEPQHLGEILSGPGTTIFEGAQGVLLDEWYGFYPYNTWSTLTFRNAEDLLLELDYAGEVLKLGLTRAYATRHGAGPFVTEDQTLTTELQDYHNQNNQWQREFRVGYLDFVALRYALAVSGGIDGLVVTNLDRLDAIPRWQTCDLYQYTGNDLSAGDQFNYRGPFVQNIKVPADPKKLTKQNELTRLLGMMKPVYSEFAKNRDEFVDFIGQTLKTPIAITSAGPTALEKENFLSLPSITGNSSLQTCFTTV